MRILVVAQAASCTTVPVADTDLLRHRTWSAAEGGLSIRHALDVTVVAPGGILPVKLFVRSSHSEQKPAHLVQGRIVHTFVPLGWSMGHLASSAVESFSGGGGVDYTGSTPSEYRVTAPLEEGQYLFFATVLSTRDDIKAFLMTARMSAQSGPWWVGTMITPAIPIEVSSGASVRPR